MPFDQFSLRDDVLCRTVAIAKEGIQLVIPVAFVDVVIQLLHDAPSAGHPGCDNLGSSSEEVLLAYYAH